MFRGYFHFFSFVVILSLCSINQVSAIKCYKCDSKYHGADCITGANRTKYAVECTEQSFLPTSEQQGNRPINVTNADYDCGLARGDSTSNNETRVIRGCAVKSTTCDIYSRIYVADHNVKVNECKRCDTDICNSSGHLKIGIWSLSLCLIALYFFKL